MKLAITGAGGFLGAEIVRQAHADPGFTRLCLTDFAVPDAPEGAEVHEGDLRDPGLLRDVLAGADAVIHLAAMLGGAAEADPLAARRINIDVPLAMIDALSGRSTRLVFASSVAVLGADLPDPVTDAVQTAPSMIYGAHKAMIEIALSCEARNGRLDAVSLRPAGVMARDGVDAGLKSAFLSRLFWALRRGEDITLPVGPDDRTWLASVRNVACNFLFAAQARAPMPTQPVTLPALAPRFGELVTALKREIPDSAATVTYTPDAEIVRLFGALPGLETERALSAGFARDADLSTLIRGAMPGLENR